MNIHALQNSIKAHDYDPEKKQGYMLKLVEEVGELAEAVRKNKRAKKDKFKGSIEEELYDVLYYVVALANVYDIDLEECVEKKEKLNQEKYKR
jgi:NTP pyrophosphatase (non-canonical NTP hydrolase)